MNENTIVAIDVVQKVKWQHYSINKTNMLIQ